MNEVNYKKYFAIGFIASAMYLCVHYIEFIISVIGNFISAISPLILGCIFAFIINILLNKIEKIYFPNTKNKFTKKTKRPICITLSLSVIILIIYIIIKLIVPELIACVKILSNEIPVFAEKTRKMAILYSEDLPELQKYLQNININWQDLIDKTWNVIKIGASGFFGSIVSAIGNVFSGITKTVIGLIFAIYILASKEKLCEQFYKILIAYTNQKFVMKTTYVLKIMKQSFYNFITGQCSEVLIIGCLCTLGMLILDMPYAVMTGVVVGVTAFVPIVGAYIGAIVGAFMICTINPMQALIFIIYLIVLQQIEGNLIYPRVVGSSIGLPGMWVLTAVTVGGGMFGILGMIITVPCAAAVYQLIKNDIKKKERNLYEK